MADKKVIMKHNDALYKLATQFCLTCPNCDRMMPNTKHRVKHGCKYCIQDKDKK
jgi:hypothetical protein